MKSNIVIALVKVNLVQNKNITFVGCSEILSTHYGIKKVKMLFKKGILFQRILVKPLAELQRVVPSESTRKVV